jgi:type IV secretory pathway VirJ component
MLSRLIAPAALLLATTATAATDTAATDRGVSVKIAPAQLQTRQNPQVTRSTNAKAAPAKTPAKPKPPVHDPQAARILDVDGLGEVTVYAPQGGARGLALFASGDGGWNLGVWDMAQTAASLGYWVAGFSTPAFLKMLESNDDECSDAARLLDHLGDKVKAQMKLPANFHPALIGYSSGATIAYAALAQAGDARFSGAMTLGFCPDLIIHKPFCKGAGLTAGKQTKPPYSAMFNTVPALNAPWIVLQGEIDQVCSPPDTVAFVDKVKNGKVVSLPHVGHGFGVPRNWMPQYRQGLIDLRDAGAPTRTATLGP